MLELIKIIEVFLGVVIVFAQFNLITVSVNNFSNAYLKIRIINFMKYLINIYVVYIH